MTVTLTQELKILTHPSDVAVQSGDTVKFTVKASGSGLKYQWYYKKSGSSTSWALWKGHTTASTSATANDTWNGMRVYCKVTDASGKSVNSNAAVITLMNLKEMNIRAGATITLKNSASGDDFTYQWYYKKKGAADWSLWKSHTSPELSVTSNSTWDGMMIHCRIIGLQNHSQLISSDRTKKHSRKSHAMRRLFRELSFSVFLFLPAFLVLLPAVLTVLIIGLLLPIR